MGTCTALSECTISQPLSEPFWIATRQVHLSREAARGACSKVRGTRGAAGRSLRACTNHLVVELRRLVRVLERAEAREAAAVRVHAQRAVREHEHVDAQVELLAADEERRVDVPRDDVRVAPRRRLPAHLLLVRARPPLHLREPVDDEDADALRLDVGFMIHIVCGFCGTRRRRARSRRAG